MNKDVVELIKFYRSQIEHYKRKDKVMYKYAIELLESKIKELEDNENE